MGGCFSGRKAKAKGGGEEAPDPFDLFYRLKGLQPPRIELSLSASKLRDLEYISKSDPMAVVYEKKKDGALEEVGRTEVIINNLNSISTHKISVAFHFDIVQQLVFRVYAMDTKYHNLSTKVLDLKDYIGEANCILSEILALQSRSMTVKLHGRDGPHIEYLDSIVVHAEETRASKMAIEMKLRCSNLDNKDHVSKSDRFLRISRVVEAGNPVPICKTEVVNNNLDLEWNPLCITVQQYVSKDSPLIIECLDSNRNGNHTFMGKLQTSIQDLENLYKMKAGANFVIPSSHSKDHEKVLTGELFVDTYEEKELYSFLDYICSGFELNFMVAVDFTASNGDIKYPDSLHYINDSGDLNAYQKAIMEVGEVIQVYDHDKRFPTWGFGGKLDGYVSHCFNLSATAGNGEVEGVKGIMDAYKNALQTVTFNTPTIFAQVVNQAAKIAAQSPSTNPTKYFVLLILTDGTVNDVKETKDAIVEASHLPLLILIVGVDGIDFRELKNLDANMGSRLESSTGRVATRDIVRFVPMRDVQEGGRSMVQALLEELPGQFVTYMRSRDIKPLGISVQ